MATQIDQGPASGNGVIIVPTAVGNQGIEIHEPTGLNPLGPQDAPLAVDPSIGTVTGNPISNNSQALQSNQANTTVAAGRSDGGCSVGPFVRLKNPA